MKTARELRAQRATILNEAKAIVEKAEGEDRDLTTDEQTQYDGKLTQADDLEKRAKRLEAIPGDLPQAPAFNKLPRGDSEEHALAAYVKTGDMGAVRSLREQDEESGKPEIRINVPTGLQKRATDQAMTLTEADGGAAVPTGFVNRIATRRSEIRLAERLGVTMVPGVGTTVNYPYENADPAVFAATSEQVDAHSNTYERDRPTTALKAFTLAKKTKKLELTEELLDDEDANLMGFIADHIGRAIALTHNSLLLTEVAASGTKLKSYASATAIAAGEPEDLVFHDTLSNYLDDGGSNAWVMKPSTYGAVKKLTGDARLYEGQTAGSGGRVLLEYPVLYSAYAGAVQASGKSQYFGNWNFVGMREDPALRLIRDPYSVDGMVILKYSFRTVYGVLIAGAIGYGQHPTG